MRSQGCTIQQALTSDAAAVVKQAVALAKRRGHAQVTPLHVAHTMLSVSSGLLRAACLQSHSHPLQCRALELCFNVALNRLPTSTAGPMLGPHSGQHQHPTIANALVAAFKRAQAHQRRGSIENQQQPLLAVKIELEQLIISILDDPSVSRVMKEAGFSSPLVKKKVEQAVSVETPSNNNNNNNNNSKPKDSNNNIPSNYNTNNSTTSCNNNNTFLRVGKPRLLCDEGGVRNEDVMSLIESLMNKRKRNSVVVGECLTTLEGLVRGVMDRVEKGSDVPEALKEVKFIHLSFSSFGHLSRDEVEQRVGELKCLVKTCCMDNNKGVILYLDDLKWVNEFRATNNNILVDQYQPRRSYYCPIEHMIMEIGKLAFGYAAKLWLLGIATFQTYMRCRAGKPSLETLWDLHAITIPAGSLALSLVPESDLQSPLTSKKLDMNGSSWLMLESGGGAIGGGVDSYKRPSNTANMESQSRLSSACNSDSTNNSSLPSWLQQYKDENSKKASNINNNDQDSVPVKDLGKGWGSICTSSSPIRFERTLSFSSISPSSSSSNFSSYDHHHHHSRLQPQPTHQSFEPKNFWVSEPSNRTSFTIMSMSPNNDHHIQGRHNNMSSTTTFISSNPNSSTPTSTSSSDIMDPLLESSQCVKFNEYTTENLKILCNALEKQVPRQKDIIYDIVSTILHCRSGMSQRKSNDQINKEETWLFFQGIDIESKEKIARELARLIFGSSHEKFISIGLSSFSSTRSVVDSLEDSRNKRLRDEQSCSYIERFAEAVSNDPHRVFLVEDIEQVDYCSQIGIKKAIERGKISKQSSGEEVSFGDAIIILSCERFTSRSRACSPTMKHKVDVVMSQEDEKELRNGKNQEDGGNNLAETTSTTSPSLSLDLNISINDDDDDNENNMVESQNSMDEIGLLASVDRCIVFESLLA